MKILLSGGGTGGHIYPALSLIRYLQEESPTSEFLFVGTERGLESKIIPAANIPFQTIEIQGFKRSLSLDTLKTVRMFIQSIGQAKKIIRQFQPDIVIGTGGYVSAAIVYAAHRLKIPTIIHEQNSVPGLTNKFLARFVDKVAICFESAAAFFPHHKTVLTGNPRGQEVAQKMPSEILETYQLSPKKNTVLVFGGSQGALKINQVMTECLPSLATKEYQVLFVTGERYYQTIQKQIEPFLASWANLAVVPYIADLESILPNIQLMVGRAGATSLAETTALGIPTILIPSPNVTNDHQTKNAQALVEKQAAVLLADDSLNHTELIQTMDTIMNNTATQQAMSQAAYDVGVRDASKRLSQLMASIIKS